MLRSRKPRLSAGLLAGIIWTCCLAAWASPATANDLFNLDSKAISTGNLIEDSSGNAYVSWLDSSSGTQNEIPKFCKIPAGGTCTNPITLLIPGTPGSNEPDQVHPVFGPGDSVYVVGPSYGSDSVVIWTSTNGGESFNWDPSAPAATRT